MTGYVTPTTLGRFFKIHGNKLKSLQSKLQENEEVFLDEKTGIWYFDLDAVMRYYKPKKPVPSKFISTRILI